MSDFLITVLIPVYNEENQIGESLYIINKILMENGINHEFLLVDDGSKDNTWGKIKEASNTTPGINAIKLSRNFGKESALCAGLEVASGDACVIIDADLQHPPQMIPEMVKLWRESGFDVIEGVKSSRGKEKLVNKMGAGLFYNLLKRSSGIDLRMASDFKLLDKKVIEAWRRMGERNTFFRGMSAWVGYKRASLPFQVAERKTGNSKWSILRLIKLAINAITSFSSLPLQIVTFLGVLFLIGSFLLGIQTLFMKIANIAVSGFTTVILLQLIIGSALMISLGIIGTYIAKIYEEVKYRPRYLVSEKITSTENKNGKDQQKDEC